MSDGIESSLNLISTSENDEHTFEMAKKLMSIKTFNTLIYGYYCDITGKNLRFVEKPVKGIDKYISGGYVESKMKYFKNSKDYSKRKWNTTDDQLLAFSENVKLLKSKGIRVILIYAPITQAYYKAFSNNDDFDKRMSSFSEYYNFNNIAELNDSLHFYDSNHLNQAGVEIFNNKLLSTIKLK